ncbi:MAG: helix-turn-helix domain-containing protein [Bacteroidia bacterium]
MKSNVIVLVDANNPFRGILASHLRERHFVRDFANHLQALQYMDEFPVQLLVYSVPPGRHNAELFIEDIRKHARLCHLPIVALIHREYPDLQRLCYQAGADICLEKPFGLDLIEDITQSLIRNREAIIGHVRRMTILPESFKKLEREDEHFIERVNEYIRDNISDLGLQVVGLADHLALSTSQLDRRISRLLGCSPKQYIRDYRMKVAHELLVDNRANVSEVASLTGFRSISYFSAKFKERYGYRPSRFRLRKNQSDFGEDFPPCVA